MWSHRRHSTAAAPLESETGESYVDEILKRLGLLETVVADLRMQLSALVTLMPTFATKSDLLEVKGELKSDSHALRAEMSAMEARLIRWLVATAIALAALAFTAAKYVY
jgi:hypothetical protein